VNCRWSSHHICRYSDVCFWLLLRFSDKVHKDFNSKNAIFEKKNYDKCAKLWLPSLVLRRFIIETVIVIGKHGICPELGDTSMKEFKLMEKYYSGYALDAEQKKMLKNLKNFVSFHYSEAEGKQLFIKINEVKDSKEWALFIKHFLTFICDSYCYCLVKTHIFQQGKIKYLWVSMVPINHVHTQQY